MNFVNNWQRLITLTAGQTSVALDLPNGAYRLTVADSATAPAAWEVVDASVTAGTATLTRGREGTADAAWEFGSVIYCGLTAGILDLLSPGFESMHLLQGGETITLTKAAATVSASVSGASPATLVVPSVDLGDQMAGVLRWNLVVSLDAGSALVIDLPAGIDLDTAYFEGSGLDVAGSYDAQAGALTITPTGAAIYLGGVMEAVYISFPGFGLALSIVLKLGQVPPQTSIY